MVGAFDVGDWIGGRFQIFDVHEGGMSLVYVVSDQMNRVGPQVVALKTLRSELLRSRVRVSRFATECRIWVQLANTRTSSALTRWKSLMGGHTSCSSWFRGAT